MQTSYKRTFLFSRLANQYLSTIKEGEETSLTAALQFVLDQVPAISEKCEKYKNRILRKNALKGDRQELLKEPSGNYKFTEAGENAAEDELEAMMNDETHADIDPEIIQELPEGLHRDFIRAMLGFVVGPETVIPKPKKK